MQLTVDTVANGIAVVRCRGRLNMATAAQLSAAVKESIAAGTVRLVIDLSETTFVDSSGLGAMISSLKQARQAGGDLRIAAAGEQVSTVLSLTNLDRVLKPHTTVKEACDRW